MITVSGCLGPRTPAGSPRASRSLGRSQNKARYSAMLWPVTSMKAAACSRANGDPPSSAATPALAQRQQTVTAGMSRQAQYERHGPSGFQDR
jgi:hypothetical protein